ncbi:hypothetical protein TNIN_395091 [Trichonephila inaurata madagascariensis]|uniref:Uncharacterized protein n=1 Tax=Trichonephila inaurata madagascariensis TaxID=2747483 RepID=A0A8X6YTK0_9ARAC|nr:hypothetical protein TNIN_395091 [Trichonephila inaurata madagascariensis]
MSLHFENPTPLTYAETPRCGRQRSAISQSVSRVTHTELAKSSGSILTIRPLTGHVARRFPCVWTPEKTSEREVLQLGRRTQGRYEELGFVTATGILETRNPSAG